MYFAFKRKIEENDFEIKHELQTDKKKTKKKDRKKEKKKERKKRKKERQEEDQTGKAVTIHPLPVTTTEHP